jgi:RsiW-degrading membrane proteinase PrsW (M82 family)
MIYLLYLFGFLPSIIWLLFYLRKDVHPESNEQILKVFLYGMIAAFCAIFVEITFKEILSPKSVLYIFVGGALVEEYLKYLVVKFEILKNSELDEPFDLMLYMIISALGFAALENILILCKYHPFLELLKTLDITTWRFLTATFLHTLCSGILGYFLALSFFNLKNQKKIFLIGLFLASTLHGFYNWFIIKGDGWILIFILPATALFILVCCNKLKEIKGICKIK